MKASLPLDPSAAPAVRAGSCLCGRTRYEVTTAARGTTYCHCEDCRRASGAPVMAWTFFATPGLRWLGPAPSEFLWEGRSRTFCPACGTPLTFFDPSLPHQFEVTTCSLSEPAAETPVDHNWVCDRLRWFDTADNLPRFTRNTP